MSLKKILFCCTLAVLVAGCSKSGGGTTTANVGGGGGTGGGSGGGGISTGTGSAGPIVLDETNIRGSIEHAAQRVNMIASEIVRALKPYLYTRAPEGLATDTEDPLDPVLPYTFTSDNYAGPLDVDQIYADANTNPLPFDPFDLGGCRIEPDTSSNLRGIYGVEFRDIDFSDALSPGDQMVFSYSADGCELSLKTNYERAPSSVSGFMIVTFAAGTDVNSDPRRMVGDVSFLDYTVENGVMARVESDNETINSGSVSFDITFSSVLTTASGVPALADVSQLILSGGSFVLANGTELLGGPLLMTFDEVRRVIHAAGDANPFDPPNPYGLGDYNLTLVNVEVESQGDGSSVSFATVGYPDPAVDPSISGFYDSYPHGGAIAIVGGEDSVGLVPSQLDSSRLTAAQVDADGDGIYELFRPTTWDLLVGQFLVPGQENFAANDD